MLKLKALREKLEANGIPGYRANQIFHAVYKECLKEFNSMNVLPSYVRDYLEKNESIFSVSVIRESTSKDKSTTKTLFKLEDGKKIEAVLMRFKDGRNTVCVSSQVGCTLGCKFCATGKLGFKRDLTCEEICDQVLYFHQLIHEKGESITNIVYMGMGEPFLNYENVMESIIILNDPVAFEIGIRNITVSTAGVVPGIKKFTKDGKQINLAVSLHAPNDKIRNKIMPISIRYNLDDLMKACNDYVEETHRRITYEYVMLSKINDSDENAHELSTLLRGQLCHVNVIPYNQTSAKGMKGSSKKRIESFMEILKLNGINATLRVSMGKDIDAACGQLANKNLQLKKK